MNQIPSSRSHKIRALIAESEKLERLMSKLQAESQLDENLHQKVRSEYRDWHSRARLVLNSDEAKSFDQLRDGKIFSTDISIANFLNNPLEETLIKDESGNPVFGDKWQHPFLKVRATMEKQRTLIHDASLRHCGADVVADELGEVFRRIPAFLRTLEHHRKNWSVAEDIKNEYDLQVIVEALLRSMFDDVRAEDFVSSKAGANSRVDFVLPEVGIVVETKMTRKGLTAKKLGDELLVDHGRYANHRQCQALVALIYDPTHSIENPRGLESDLLASRQDGPSMTCIVVTG